MTISRLATMGKPHRAGARAAWVWLILLGMTAVAIRLGSPSTAWASMLLSTTTATSMASTMAVDTSGDPPPEYQVKAAFLLNFLQFIEWPASSFASPETPIRVGVLGDDPFGSNLDETVKNETVQNRRITLKRARYVEDLKDCHLIFISRSEKDRLTQILASVNDLSIVTVSETDGFAERGGIINFYIETSKVRFEINPAAAERKQLKINSQLLRRARIVGPDPERRKR